MGSWPRNNLGEIVDFLSGFAWKAANFSDDRSGVPIIRIQNVDAVRVSDFVYWVDEYDSRFIVKEGDLLLTLSGSFRVEFWAGPNALLNQRIVKITPKSGIDSNWLMHSLRGTLAQIEAMGRHALVNNVALSDLRQMELSLPPLEEQKRIAAILDQADDIRRKRQHAIKRLNQLGQAIFHEMFEAEIASPNRTALGDLVQDFRYGTSNKSGDSGYPTLRIPNVVRGEIDSSDLKTVPLDDAEFKRLKLFDGDVLFVRTNGNQDNVGRSAVFTLSQANSAGFEHVDWAYASYLIRARPRKAVLNSWFLQAYLSHPNGRKSLKERSKTSAGQYNINTEGLGSIPIPISPIEKQISFAKKIEDMGPMMQPLLVAAQEADLLFASLQHRAFAGEL